MHLLNTSTAYIVLILTLSPCLLLLATDTQVADPAQALQTCLGITTCLHPSRATSWSDFLENRPPCLSVHRIWWSPRPAALPAVLVTQLSADRVLQLSSQCATWRGPLAAALHISLPHEDLGATRISEASLQLLAGAERRITRLVLASEGLGHCQLRVMLVYEFLAQPRAASLYPVNSLRNYARLMADAELMANIDVDMVPSVTLSASLQLENSGRPYLEACRGGTAYVLAAFDIKCGGPAFADAACLQQKNGLLQLVKEECVAQFRQKVAPASHNATEFGKWAITEEPYRIQFQEFFEPWLLTARARTPWFDFRFRGYGKNKIVQAMHMNWTGTHFDVHSTAFIIHRPHNESRARKEFLSVKKSVKKPTGVRFANGSIYQHIEALYASTKVELQAGLYSTQADPGMMKCLRDLPWWRSVVIKLGSDR